MGFLFSKPHVEQNVAASVNTEAAAAKPVTTTTTTASTPCTSNNIPAYTEDPTYHGHGGRVFVKDGVCVPSTWSVDTSVPPPN